MFFYYKYLMIRELVGILKILQRSIRVENEGEAKGCGGDGSDVIVRECGRFVTPIFGEGGQA